MSRGDLRLRALFSILRIRLAEGLQYRLAALSGAVVSIFWGLIEIIVLTVFFTHGDRAALPGISGGMGLGGAVSYVWIAQFMHLMQPMGVDGAILAKIDSGDIGLELCRPLHLYDHWLAHNAARSMVPLLWRGGLVLLAGILMPRGYHLAPPASLLSLFCALIALLGALALCSSVSTLLCALRLHVQWGNGPIFALGLLGGVLSGTYLPLMLWPGFLQIFLLYQPFAGYMDIPARLYLGLLSPEQTVGAVGLQLGWSILFFLLGRGIMARRLRKIVVQGG